MTPLECIVCMALIMVGSLIVGWQAGKSANQHKLNVANAEIVRLVVERDRLAAMRLFQQASTVVQQ